MAQTKTLERKDTTTANSADVHQLVMTLASTNNPDQLPGGAMTGDQSDERLRIWLEQGFAVKTAQVIQSGDVNGIFTLQIYYCLIKD